MKRRACLLFAFLAILGGSSTAWGADLQQLTAIWQFSGAAFPLPDEHVSEIISKVFNPLTSIPWGNAVQSGGYNYLCNVKLGIDCSKQYTPGSGAGTGTDSGAANSTGSTGQGRPSPGPSVEPNPSVTIGIAPAPSSVDSLAGAGGVTEAGPPAAAPALAAAAGVRRRLQAKDNVYLKLDTTEGAPGIWTPQFVDSMVATVRSLVSSGELQTALDASTTVEAKVSLLYVGLSSIPGPPSSAGEPATSAPPTASGPAPPSPLPLPDFLPFPPMGGGGMLSGPPPPPQDDATSSSGSNKTVLIIVLCCVAGGVVVAVAGLTCFLRRKRRRAGRADAELMVHRWSRDREAASLQRAKLGGGSYRGPMDVAHSVHSARSMGSKDLDMAGLRSFRAPNTRAQRSDLGLSQGLTPVDLRVDAAQQMGQQPPTQKKGFFDFLYW